MTSFHCLGLSRDGRTNKWRLTLPCGHDKEPATTLLASQVVSCDRCAKEFWVNYNNRTMASTDD